MGTRQARLQRHIDNAHERYTACLLALGLPESFITHNTVLYEKDYYDSAMKLYVDMCDPLSPPGTKAQKRFVRGYLAWLRKQHVKSEASTD